MWAMAGDLGVERFYPERSGEGVLYAGDAVTGAPVGSPGVSCGGRA